MIEPRTTKAAVHFNIFAFISISNQVVSAGGIACEHFRFQKREAIFGSGFKFRHGYLTEAPKRVVNTANQGFNWGVIRRISRRLA